MLIRIGFEMTFELSAPAPMVLLLDTHPERDFTIRRQGGLRIEPWVPNFTYLDAYGNRAVRLVALPGRLRLWDDLIVSDSGLPEEPGFGLRQLPIEELPPDVMVYLHSSRYCEVDLLVKTAWDLFGQTPPGWARVQAICDWVHSAVTFGYKHARPTKTAFETYQERNGVCRDFTHLALTFCRCMNIPARYATGYLGDIGVPPSPTPMDFSGWFEVYLGGRWVTFDARHNVPRIGRVVMARGRDAVDGALTTIFARNELLRFTVWTDEVPEEALGEPAASLAPAE